MNSVAIRISLTAIETLVDGLDHPECVAWDPAAGVLYAGGEAGQIYAIEDGAARQIADAGGFVLGLAIDGYGRVYACAGARVVRVTPATGAVEVYSLGAPDEPMRTPNYLAFGADGSLYVTDSGEWGARSGLIYRVDPSGATMVWTRDLPAFTNGCCLTPAGDALAVVQSQDPGVWRVPIGPDGRAGPAERLCALPGTVPDGVAYDSGGALYVACYRPDRIYRLTADGALAVLAEDPCGVTLASPTNLAFFGVGLSQIAAANLGRWHVSVLDAGESGQELARPRVGGAV